MSKKPVTFSTLADFKGGGMNLWANCSSIRCAHGSKMDIDLLIKRFGASYEPVGNTAIERSIVCKQCGSRDAILTISHGHGTTDVGARREEGGAN